MPERQTIYQAMAAAESVLPGEPVTSMMVAACLAHGLAVILCWRTMKKLSLQVRWMTLLACYLFASAATGALIWCVPAMVFGQEAAADDPLLLVLRSTAAGAVASFLALGMTTEGSASSRISNRLRTLLIKKREP